MRSHVKGVFEWSKRLAAEVNEPASPSPHFHCRGPWRRIKYPHLELPFDAPYGRYHGPRDIEGAAFGFARATTGRRHALERSENVVCEQIGINVPVGQRVVQLERAPHHLETFHGCERTGGKWAKRHANSRQHSRCSQEGERHRVRPTFVHLYEFVFIDTFVRDGEASGGNKSPGGEGGQAELFRAPFGGEPTRHRREGAFRR